MSPPRRRLVAVSLGFLGLLGVLLLAVPRPTAAAESAAGPKKDPVRAITSQLICPCSCGEILSGCTCETAVALNAFVERELKAGKDRHAIEAALVAKYGEVILGAPKAKGFNIVVWIAPFVATLIGLGIASMVLARWVRRKREPAGALAGGGADRALDVSMDALRARAEAELRELKE
jgi:cytochrome c-type biogenesis protein CcmH/NrfF